MKKIVTKIEPLLIYAVFFLLPLITLPFFPNNFDTPKLILLFSGFTLLSIVKITKSILTKEFKANFTSHDIWILLFICIYAVSAIVKTPNIYDALFLPGTANFIILAGIYYLFINQLETKQKSAISNILVFSAMIVSILQILSFSGYYKQVGFTTFGNLTTTVVFLLSILPIAVFGVIKDKKIINKILYGIAGFIIFVSSFSLVYLLLPDKPTSLTLPSYSVSWSVAVDTLKNNPLLGIGPGNFVESFTRHKPLSFNQTDLWNIRFNTATNQILTILTETGILGLIAFLFLSLFFLRRPNWEKPEYVSSLIIVLAFFVIPFSYSLFVIFLFFLAQINQSKKVKYENTFSHSAGLTPTLLINLPFMTIVVVATFFAGKTILSEYYFNQSLISLNSSLAEPAFSNINKAITLNPKIDRYHLIASTISLGVAESLSQQEDLTDDDNALINQLIQQGISEAKATTTLNPSRILNWENLATIYKNVIPFAEGANQFAIQSYNQAIFLEPVNPNLRIDLGGIYYSAKEYDTAIRIFELAVVAKPDLANARYNLAIAYRENQQLQKAKSELELTLSLLEEGSNDYQLVKTDLENLESQKEPSPILEETLEEIEEITPPQEPQEPVIDF